MKEATYINKITNENFTVVYEYTKEPYSVDFKVYEVMGHLDIEIPEQVVDLLDG